MTYPTPFKDYVPPVVVAQPAVQMLKSNPTPDENAATKADADGDFDGNTDAQEKMIDKLRALKISQTK